MHNKIEHPGQLLANLVLKPSGLSQSAAARRLGFNQPQPVNELVKGKRSITPKMALLLERATAGNYPAEFWLLAQMRWDIEQARYNLPRTRLALVEGIPASRDEGKLPGEPDALLAACEELRKLDMASSPN